MTRILLISGDVLDRQDTLRRKVLRFTGSRGATRAILSRLESARRLGHVMSCMVLPTALARRGEHGDDAGWDVRVSFVNRHRGGGARA